MFTGIVQAAVPVHAIERRENLHTLHLRLPEHLRSNLAPGASIAVNGVCLTVTRIGAEGEVAFDVMAQTLRLTNLGGLGRGMRVNVERAARFGDEIGGHPLSGHVHDTVRVVRIEKTPNNLVMTFACAHRWLAYILPQGYVALNGCSLTVASTGTDSFQVHFIPETLRVTVFGESRTGNRVNLEIDSQTQAIVNTVERVLARRAP